MNDAVSSTDRSAAALPLPGLLRRLAAMVYDGLLVLALLMIVTACFLPFTGGEAVTLATLPTAHAAVLAGARRRDRRLLRHALDRARPDAGHGVLAHPRAA